MSEKLKLGVMTHLGNNPDELMKKVADFGLNSAQVQWPPSGTAEMADALKQSADAYGIEISTLWAGLPGPAVWNFTEGPITIGLVPPEYRAMRVDALCRAAEMAARIGVPSITTHVGFIPDWPGDILYKGTIIALQTVARACKANGVEFWFETGQETPITLLRTIQDIGTDNLGINLDPANLLMYGKANPVDALDVFGQYVKGTHCKDGEYPTDGVNLGKEMPMGEGRVNFPVLIPKLKSMGFSGHLTIEREISGPKQIEDIRKAMAILEPLR
ncbi:MAG: sugar phosphate isomerase/epimerase [Armatimonadetes bacterium]|nr:sugar phosphate isomerase/epimerase [Armatimonadota bacterium]